MMEVGRLCLKTAGREAGRMCVVVELLDRNYALIDGEVRRKKCNITHLEPINKKIEIKSKAPHSEIVEKFKELGIKLIEKKSRPKKEKPVKTRGRKGLGEKEKEGKKKKEGKGVKVKKNANMD